MSTSRSLRTFLHFTALATLAACGGGGGGNPPPIGVRAPGFSSQQSSPISLSSDDRLLLSTNPDTHSVSLFDTSGATPQKTCEIAVGREPRSVAIRGDGARAYVANAISGTVSVLDLAGRTVTATIQVGTEPRALCLTPNGRRLYVANSIDASISVIDTTTDTVVQTIAIPSAIGTHPRALAITNDGDADDTDETVYAALFFAERRAGRTGLDEGQDDQREGRVLAIDTATGQLGDVVALAPIAVTGFRSNGSVLDRVGTQNGVGGVDAPDPSNPNVFAFDTSAYPNQLASLAIRPGTTQCYVVSTGASPNGPFRFNLNAQGLLSVFSITDNQELIADTTDVVHRSAPLNLNRGLKQDTDNLPTIFLSNPSAIAWRPDGSEGWIAVQNADVLVRVTAGVDGVPTIDAPVAAGGSAITRIDLSAPDGDLLPGHAPRGLAIDSKGERAYVWNFVSQSISVIDLATRRIVATAEASPVPAPGTPQATAHFGAQLFFSGRGPDERMSAEAWGSCATCHPDGLSDNVTWMFPAGPRQTIPLDGMFSRSGSHDQRILNWSALRDENHDFELNTRNVFGGRGLIDDDRALFLFGGRSAGTDRSAVSVYEQFTNLHASTNPLAGDADLPPLPSARRDSGLATLGDGRVYVVGGRFGAGQGALVSGSDLVLEFDPASNTIRSRSAIGFRARHSFGLVAAETSGGPRIYAIGGFESTGASALPSASVQEYDPATDSWRDVANLPLATAEFGVAASGPVNSAEPRTEVSVLCGNRGSEGTPNLTGSIHRYVPDPSGAGAWRTLGFEFAPRRNLGGASVVRGVAPSHIFAIGGRDAAGLALTTVEAFVAPTDARVATPLTALPSALHSFAIGASIHRIYVFGGVDAGGAEVGTGFEYNPAANPTGGTAGAPGTPAGVWTARAALDAPLSRAQLSTPAAVANFLTVGNKGRDARQDAIAEWIARAVRSYVAPNRGVVSNEVLQGRGLFAQPGLTGVDSVSCASCHGGPKWTRSTVDFVSPPSADLAFGEQRVVGAELRRTRSQPEVLQNVGTFLASQPSETRFNPSDQGQRIAALGNNGFNIPSLLGIASTRPYFHNGIAGTLEEVLDGSLDGNGASPLRSVHHVTDPTQRALLIEFLRSIDETTVTF